MWIYTIITWDLADIGMDQRNCKTNPQEMCTLRLEWWDIDGIFSIQQVFVAPSEIASVARIHSQISQSIQLWGWNWSCFCGMSDGQMMLRLTWCHMAGLLRWLGCRLRRWLCCSLRHGSGLWFCWVSNGRRQGLRRMCWGWTRLSWLGLGLHWRLGILIDIPRHIHPSLWRPRWWLTWCPGSCSFSTGTGAGRRRRSWSWCRSNRGCSRSCSWCGWGCGWGCGWTVPTGGPGLVDVPLGFLDQI